MAVKRSGSGLRVLDAPFVVAPPSGTAAATRLKVTPSEHEFLVLLGGFLGGLYRTDLALLVREGNSPVTPWKERKKRLSDVTSSRWAGSITKAANKQYRLGMRNLIDERNSLRLRVTEIQARAKVPIGWATDTKVRPYRSEWIRFQKLRRSSALLDRLRLVEARIESGRPRIVVGGRQLLQHRNNLVEANLTQTAWRRSWNAARVFLAAEGETGRRYGNDTIKISPDGTVQIYVPTALRSRIPSGVAVTPDGRKVVLTAPVTFHHRGDVWADRVADNQAVAYTITYDPEVGRWKLGAAWTYDTVSMPLSYLQTQRTLAVDFNADHFAAWIIDPAGNPVGPPATFECELTGLRASTRDGLLRHTITRMLRYAQQHGCASLTVENLNFTAESAGKDDPKTSKRLRRTVAGMPTGQFRDRLVAMAATAGIALVAVDPAYTSKWGKQYWVKPLQARHTPTQTPASAPAASRASTSSRTTPTLSVSTSRGSHVSVTGHHSAAVVIGRRMYGHKARRQRMNEPLPAQSSRQGQPVPHVTPCATPIPVEPTVPASVSPVQVSPSQPEAEQGSTITGSPTPFMGHKVNTG